MDNEDVVILRLLLAGNKIIEICDKVNLSQPAITARISKLRKYFDDPLLIRSGKEMVPTDKMISLTNEITRLHENIESLYPIETFDARNTPTIINIYLSDAHCHFCFDEYIDVIYAVSDQHEVCVTVFPVEQGIEGRYDFQNADIIIGVIYPVQGYIQEIIAWDEYQLVHNLDKLKKANKVTMAQYLKLPQVVFAKNDESNPFLEYLSRPDPRNVVLRTNHADIAYESIAAGEYVATIGSFFAKKNDLSYVSLPFATPKIPVGFCYPGFLQLDAKNRWLRGLCAKVIRDKARQWHLKLER